MFTKNDPIYCIVCGKDSFLGLRPHKNSFLASCKECKTEYYYAPNSKVPTKNRPIRTNKNTCNCGGCEGDDNTWWIK